jgi:hypothetical protein
MRFLRLLLAFAFVMLLPVVALFAQDPVPVPPPDWSAMAVVLIGAAGSALVAVVVWGVRMAMGTSLPRFIWPLIGYGLGFVLTWLVGLQTGHEFSPIVAALIGTGATWVREIINTINQYGLNAKLPDAGFTLKF